MKKINLILSTGIVATMMLHSCQQKPADPAVLEAKVKEAYEAKIQQINQEADAACSAQADAQVAKLKDSLSQLSAAQQAAAQAKIQKDLAAKAAKAQAEAKKKNIAVAKPKTSDGGNGTDTRSEAQKKLDDRFNTNTQEVQKKAEKAANDKLNERFNTNTQEAQKKAEDAANEKLKSRF